jgi:hypothetical protein
MKKLIIIAALIISHVSCNTKEDSPSLVLKINKTSFSIGDTLFVTFENNTNSICKYLVCDATPNPHIDIMIRKFNTSKNTWEGFVSPFCGTKLLYLGGEIESGGALKDTIQVSLFPDGRYKAVVAIKEYSNGVPVSNRELDSKEFIIQ